MRRCILSLFLAAPGGWSSTCFDLQPPVCSRIDRTEIVFLGEMVSSGALERFRILEPFKGLAEDVTEVWLDPVSGPHIPGKQYLILGGRGEIPVTWVEFRKRLPAGFDPNTSFLVSTDMCAGNLEADRAADDLAFLRAFKRGQWRRSIIGRVNENGFPALTYAPPIAGVKVILSGPGTQRETFSGPDGRFAFQGVATGDYRVELQRDEFQPGSPFEEVTAPATGCGWVDAVMHSNGRIRMRINSREGIPVPNIEVSVIPGQDRAHTKSVKANRAGELDISGLASGDYLIAVNPNGAYSIQNPYPTLYYPGVPEAAQAQLVHLEPNHEITDLELRLPDPIPARHVRIRVVDPAGAPIQGATVFAMGTNPDLASAYQSTHAEQTDRDGRTMLVVLSDVDYTIQAWHEFEREGHEWSDFKRWQAHVPLPAKRADAMLEIRFTEWRKNKDWD